MPALDPALEARIDALWAVATARSHLFNGRIFSVDRVLPGVIEGHWSEYRRIIAQLNDPTLVRPIGVRNLAVVGVIHTPQGQVAVGRREPRASYQRGLWQLCPAGSVDHGAATPGGADWRHAILSELEEELGLHAADFTAMTPYRLVDHPHGVVDLGIRLQTRLDAATLKARHAARGNAEYDALEILPPAELLALTPLSPAAPALLRQSLGPPVSAP